jgi:hypothetical protein
VSYGEDFDDSPYSYPQFTRLKDENYPCQRVPAEMFKQREIWVDAKQRVIPIAQLQDGHLDNLIKWIREHSEHWKKVPVLVSPLMRALEAEQKKRFKTRNVTPRQALKDVMLNDSVVARAGGPPPIDSVVTRIIGGLHDRGFEIKKKS